MDTQKDKDAAALKKQELDQKNAQVDITKGKKYKARTNISFGKSRPQVMAGETFNLDDPELAKELLASNSITADLDHVEDFNTVGGTNAGLTQKELAHAPGTVRTAAEQRGDAADEAQEADGDKNKTAKGAGK